MKTTRARLAILPVIATLIAAFALSFLPHAVSAEAPAALSAGNRSEAAIDELVERMLSTGDYIEGEAIVCYMPTDNGELTTQASDLLAGAEHLSEVTSRQYAEATGQALPASEEGVLTAQSAEQPVEVAFVRSDGATTSELLRELLCDPRVLSAEPNYIGCPAEEGSDDTAAEVLTADALAPTTLQNQS